MTMLMMPNWAKSERDGSGGARMTTPCGRQMRAVPNGGGDGGGGSKDVRGDFGRDHVHCGGGGVFAVITAVMWLFLQSLHVQQPPSYPFVGERGQLAAPE